MNSLKCSFVSYDGDSFAIDFFASNILLHVSVFTPHFPPSFQWGKPNFTNTAHCNVQHGPAGFWAWSLCKDIVLGTKPPLCGRRSGGPAQDFGELGGRCHLSMDGERETRDLARSSSA